MACLSDIYRRFFSTGKTRFTPIVLRLLSIFLGLATESAIADVLSPDQVHVTTPRYKPNTKEFSPPFGTYEYEVSWQGIPAAQALARVEKSGDSYVFSTSVKTYPVIDLLYKLRYRAESAIAATDFLPRRLVIKQRENSKVKNIEVNFRPNGDIKAVRSTAGEAEKIVEFNPNNFTLDPFSAVFLARSLDWQVGQSREFDTFNGKSRYLVTLRAESKKSIDLDGQQKEVFVIVPAVTNLTNPEASSKLRQAKIYVTADSARDVVKIVSSVFIGSVTTKLRTFTGLGSTAEAQLLAQDESFSSGQKAS